MAAPSRNEFISDNSAGICPEAWEALSRANAGNTPPYGDDEWTRQLCDRIREIFETDCDVYLTFNGTAANALALAQLGRSFNSVLCHEHAHLENDECGACEFFSGGAKLIPTTGSGGKLEVAALEEALARQHELHSSKAQVLSVTQATELGTVYRAEELRALSEFAKSHRLRVHMDGARFANALAHLKCSPRAATAEVGVDVLTLGGTKNGLAAGELVIFFSPEHGRDFDYRLKQGGQLASKMRFLAAPWLELLRDGLWLKNAERANRAARGLGAELEKNGAEVAFPIEANAVFLRLSKETVVLLRNRGWQFYKFIEPDIYRFMCCWNTSETSIADFVGDWQRVNICSGGSV